VLKGDVHFKVKSSKCSMSFYFIAFSLSASDLGTVFVKASTLDKLSSYQYFAFLYKAGENQLPSGPKSK